ncbi:TIR domain-containing protein [Geminicoccus harenae]|uniref:TIR domain-containing protein n=1 Tax=Geminicoccus harenae TaxID=2498453 RepID=UPI001C95372A|nr:nucleotide-binding protein [Geminicoccus harenae]
MDLSVELLSISFAIDQLLEEDGVVTERRILDSVIRTAADFDSRSSKSWTGYFADVYYGGLRQPPPGDTFDPEWGFLPSYEGVHNKRWDSFSKTEVRSKILELAGLSVEELPSEHSRSAQALFSRSKAAFGSILDLFLRANADSFLSKIQDDLRKLEIATRSDFLRAMTPKGYMICRDPKAISQGTRVPPHIDILVEAKALAAPFGCLERLKELASTAAEHQSRLSRLGVVHPNRGNKVFIGHGRSATWRELKDFLSERLNVPCDEFNRVPVAGHTTVDRLKEMLDSACLAFLIMTAEDEQNDGSVRARQNVVHEAGLFQGRLGFSRAIVMLEEGCDAFSNIHGLTYIWFPKGNIAASFEEVRRVMEREGLA